MGRAYSCQTLGAARPQYPSFTFMIDTAIAQLRFAYSLVTGKPFAPWSLDWLIAAMRASQQEFGDLGQASAEWLTPPQLDAETARTLALRRFRTQAGLAARTTSYYADYFAAAGVQPAKLTADGILSLPLTPKATVRDQPTAFVRHGATPHLCATTTGTTGQPTTIYFSQQELRVYAALEAIGALTNGEIQPDDVVQISTSARALLGNLCLAGACTQVGALVTQTGIVDPAYTLAQLCATKPIPGKRAQVSVLSTYPSYLGELVETGLRLGYRPQEFGLRRIIVGGELVSEGLRRRATELFGEIPFSEGFGMTEVWPVGGRRCEAGHLHWEPSHGLVEVIDPLTQQPASPGTVGTLVITPFPPFRETTLLLRYNTEDLVYALSPHPLLPQASPGATMPPPTCSLRHLPATSNVLGKARLAVPHGAGWSYPRQLIEALEALDCVPLPARFGFETKGEGISVTVVVRTATAATRACVTDALLGAGLPLTELTLVTDHRRLHQPYPLRGDLREITF